MDKLTGIIAEELSHKLLVDKNISIKNAYDICKDIIQKTGIQDINIIDTVSYNAIILVSMMPIHQKTRRKQNER